MINKKYPLFNPDIFHDACGVGFVATSNGKPDPKVLPLALSAMKRLTHRGAKAYDGNSGDGSGILVDIPKSFFKSYLLDKHSIKISKNDTLVIASIFAKNISVKTIKSSFLNLTEKEKIDFVSLRVVPIDDNVLGDFSKQSLPKIMQLIFLTKAKNTAKLERKLYLIRKKIERDLYPRYKRFYICSFSSKTIVYKGLLSSDQLVKFYKDLTNDLFVVKVVLFHERFSTNTFSSWEMAQPFRMIAHNGEFNTIKGSRLWMNSREGNMESKVWKKNIDFLKPITKQTGSDSESFDNSAEFLKISGRDIFDTMMIMIPDSYEQTEKYYNNKKMNKMMRDYFIYHENFMKPWDGPAAIVFTDGDFVGAKMDRNGLRPLRYSITKDGLIIMASEAGIVDIDDDNIISNYHMKSEEIFGLSLNDNKILDNKFIKSREASKKPYGKLVDENLKVLRRGNSEKEFGGFFTSNNQLPSNYFAIYGIYSEDIKKFVEPLSAKVSESIGSIGDDTPIAIFSRFDRKFYDFFKQQFAQVTNPPIDSLRENSVMSLYKYLGSEDNLLNNAPTKNSAIRISSPILSPKEVNDLKSFNAWFPHVEINCLYRVGSNLNSKILKIRKQCEESIYGGKKIIFITDQNPNVNHIPIPMLLVISAVHHHLIKKKLRSKVSLIAVTGDTIEDHHFAALISLGASAIYPHFAYEIIFRSDNGNDYKKRLKNYRASIEKGLLKIMSKMGISTLSGYHGSMLFHAIGIGPKLMRKYFPSLKSQLGGIEIKDLEKYLKSRYENSINTFKSSQIVDLNLFRFRKNGELHGFNPLVFKKIQNISRSELKVLKESEPELIYIRDALQFSSKRKPLTLKEVEKTKDILKRFGSGGVSFGAISEKAHLELSRGFAMAGARSNTGEGGEPRNRYSITNQDKLINSSIKQIASGRFGVNAEYLSAAQEIQIKIAQGAKPGEGGQLPAFKVSNSIASARSAVPGIPLISPPPHHDIYSIEDIKQLIYDLKDVNPRAKVSVKLVSQPGVGVVAAGVVKAGANIILISGSDGGTGASPLGSQKHAGFPWEYGLAETHQTLIANGLREYVTLRVDGGLKWAKDIIFAAILGAEEFDFGTSALVALGCVMARQCHMNNCPVGIATTDEKYEKKFKGYSENIETYLKDISLGVQNELRELGFNKIHNIIGRTDLLSISKKHEMIIRNRRIDLSKILNFEAKKGLPLQSEMKIRFSNYRREKTLDEKIIAEIRQEIVMQGHVVIEKKINNIDRSMGARLSGEISYLFGSENFKGKIQCKLTGTAGQSFGSFLSNNIELRLKGIANDYVGKSMSSGIISVRMHGKLRNKRTKNSLIGNVALYGATGGELFVEGKGGERFGVRNSGAVAIIEGIGNHGCEYMSQGTVVILGIIGKNFGAGMTGGVAFIYNKKRLLKNYLNHDFILELKLETKKDENIILDLIRKHVFHTNSKLGKRIIKNWIVEKANFKKIVPKATKGLNIESIYDSHISTRI